MVQVLSTYVLVFALAQIFIEDAQVTGCRHGEDVPDSLKRLLDCVCSKGGIKSAPLKHVGVQKCLWSLLVDRMGSLLQGLSFGLFQHRTVPYYLVSLVIYGLGNLVTSLFALSFSLQSNSTSSYLPCGVPLIFNHHYDYVKSTCKTSALTFTQLPLPQLPVINVLAAQKHQPGEQGG